MKEKTVSKTSTGIFIVMVIGILVLVNIVSARLFGRLDLTEDQRFSLADSSKEIMAGLDDQVYAKAYFTADLPAPYNGLARFVRDLFEEYSAYSKGKFQFEFIDPGEDEGQRGEMMMLGIPPVQIQEIRDDKFQVRQVYLGIVFYFADKKEVIPIVKSTVGLEYDITSAIKKLTADKLRTVAIMQGYGTPDYNEQMRGITQALSHDFKAVPIDLSSNAADKLDEADTLLIVNPTSEIPDEQLYLIDQFLMKGRTLAFLTNNIDVNIQETRAKKVSTGLEKLLQAYGFTIKDDLLLDLQNKRINVSSQQGMYQIRNIINYPLIPVITDFDPENVLTSRLDALGLPFMSSLVVSPDTEKVTYQVLGRTSPRSWSQSGVFNINPMEDLSPKGESEMGPFSVIASAKGKFTSYFAKKANESNGIVDSERFLSESPETRILVVSGGNFVTDQFGDPNNIVFITNCVDWLVQDNALISIRGRGIQSKPIAELENWERDAIKYLNLIGVPLFFILYGLFRWQMRKARKRGLQLASK